MIMLRTNLRKKLPSLIRDNAETLYKSTRRSQLQATRDVCNAYRNEIKGTASEKYDLESIKEIEKYLNIEESKLTQGNFVDINLNDDEIKQLLSIDKKSGDEKLRQFQTDLTTHLINELPKGGSLPKRFVEMLKNGWQKDESNYTFLQKFEAHFNQEFAKPEVANVFFKKALGGMQFSLDELLEAQTKQERNIEELRKLIETKADKLEQLGYRILRESGKVSGIEITEKRILDAIKETQVIVTEYGEKNLAKLEDIRQLLEVDKALTSEEREAKEKQIVDNYLTEQIKDYPIGEIVGDIHQHNKFFVDRIDEKQSLAEWLLGDEKIVIIRGISGEGKTALMTEVVRAIVPDNTINHDRVKGILMFYFRHFSGKVLDVNLLDICKKADARLAKDEIKLGFALQYEEFRKTNPSDIPEQIISNLCSALNALGNIWIIFDNFESALENGQIRDKEIESFVRFALNQNNLRFLITSQVFPQIAGVNNIRQCSIGELPANYAKEFLWSKGAELKANHTDCGLAEATDEQFDELFEKLNPSPISLISFTAYLETVCDTDGKGFEDVLADETLFAGFADFDDKNKGARVLIRRQFDLLSNVEQFILKALSIFPNAIEFPVLQAILPLSLEKEILLSTLKSNSLVRKSGRNLYELLPLPKEVIAKQFEQSQDINNFNLKAAQFYRSIHKPVDDCYTLEDFDTYFKEIEHYYQAGFYGEIVGVINEIIPKTNPLGMMQETLDRSRKIQDNLDHDLQAKAANLTCIGLALDNLGKSSEAIKEYDESIKIYEELVNQQGRIELKNDLAKAYLNKGVALEQKNDSVGAVEMFGLAIELWEENLKLGFGHNVPNLVKALRIRVESLIKLEDWNQIADDAIKSLILFSHFTQDEDFSEHFKQQLGGDFVEMIRQIKQLAEDNQEKVFAIANKIGQTNEPPVMFGDILREYVGQV